METTKKISTRQHYIAAGYLKEVDKHISDIICGHTDKMFGINDFARMLHVHPRHLTDIVTWVPAIIRVFILNTN